MEAKFISISPNNNKTYLQNSMFDLQNNKNRITQEPIYSRLKKNLEGRNIYLNTYDIYTITPPYKIVHYDVPFPIPSNFSIWLKIVLNRNKNILMCVEPPIVNPFTYMKVLHHLFIKIYTWNDDLVDNKKYFKLQLPRRNVGINTRVKTFKDKKFLILINANKSAFFPFRFLSSFGKELYSQRIKAIEFFEKKIPEKFSLYGVGWNQPKKYNLKEKILGFKRYSTYKGAVDDKIKLLSNFKYCICFENLTNVNGYITEKIFDCFKARCVPIYWGTTNIEKYIPKNCFIDFRDFYDYGKLFSYLDSIDESKYNNYIENIERLLADKTFTKLWFEDGFVNFFLKDVLEIKDKSKSGN